MDKNSNWPLEVSVSPQNVQNQPQQQPQLNISTQQQTIPATNAYHQSQQQRQHQQQALLQQQPQSQPQIPRNPSPRRKLSTSLEQVSTINNEQQQQNVDMSKSSILKFDSDALFFRCDIEGCQALFTSYQDMNKHKILHAALSTKKQQTAMLRKASQSLPSYSQPMQREGNHRCDLCGKTLSSRRCLKEHLQRHSGEKPFLCDVNGCGKSFVNDQSLSDHRATHFDERPFECDYSGCGKRFKNNGQLRGHRLAVHKPPNMRCQFYGCEYSARRSRHMQVHISKKHSEQLNRIGSIFQNLPNEQQ